MTFTEIVTEVTAALNLTSTEAITRVGRRVNRRYRRVVMASGLREVARRANISFAVTASTRLQTIPECEKVLSIFDNTDSLPREIHEITYAEMQAIFPQTGIPYRWAVKRQGSRTVTLQFDSTMTAGRTLTIEVLELGATLSGSMEPAFPESMHDVLVYGALADELRKKEKTVLARDAEAEYERFLSEIKLFVAVSGYKDVQSGRNRLTGYGRFPNKMSGGHVA
jgi:hypothetical protein